MVLRAVQPPELRPLAAISSHWREHWESTYGHSRVGLHLGAAAGSPLGATIYNVAIAFQNDHKLLSKMMNT